MSRKHRREILFPGSPGLISAKGGGREKETMRIEGSNPPQFKRSHRLMIANRMTCLPGLGIIEHLEPIRSFFTS